MFFTPPDHYDDAVAKRYLDQLADTPSLMIESVLPPEQADEYASALETIVKADMAARWQKLNFGGPVEIEQATFVKPPVAETYLEKFPQLNADEVIGRIASWEFSLRKKIGDRPIVLEYTARFPQLGDGFDWSGEGDRFDATGDRRIGMTVGAYRIESQIGEGNCTVSYRATQFRPVRRDVVVKFVKDQLDSPDVLSRFRFELASIENIDHPCAPAVIDAGATTSGGTYFVMPWVDGVAVTDHVRQQQAPVADRLSLFLDVCDAVQQSHRKGVIHRDLKPSNLIATRGENLTIKILDFGVARAIGNRIGQQSVATHFGQSFSAPHYVSPEQASFNPSDADTRSDVYSLGAVLYELLAGQPPFADADLNSQAIDKTLRTIRQVVPDAPSRSSPDLSRELDWIVLKSLEKDREQRYQSPGELAQDIRRYLSCEPVQAVPQSIVYRANKYAKRKPVQTIAAFLAFIVLLAVFVLGIKALMYPPIDTAYSNSFGVGCAFSLTSRESVL